MGSSRAEAPGGGRAAYTGGARAPSDPAESRGAGPGPGLNVEVRWVGDADARPLAAFRVALGLLLTYDIVDRLRDFHAFYTEAGLAARGGWLPPGALFAGALTAALALPMGAGP